MKLKKAHDYRLLKKKFTRVDLFGYVIAVTPRQLEGLGGRLFTCGYVDLGFRT